MIKPRLACPSCQWSVGLGSPRRRCGACGGSLLIRGDVSGARPAHDAPGLIARYRAFLPFADAHPTPSLGEGGTPLVASTSLGPLLDLAQLFFKLEHLNPTGTTLDRGSVAAIQRVRELGVTWIGSVSDDALGVSTAAYAARTTLSCAVVVAAPPEAVVSALALHGARLIQVDGPPAALCAASRRAGRGAGVYFANADDPFRAEGQKTLAYELADECPGGPLDYVVAPVGPELEIGSLAKGFLEWRQAGLADAEPIVLGVRRTGSSDPGEEALAVDDRDVRAARRLLAAEEGLLVSLESAAAFAGLVRAVRGRRIPRGARVVVVLAGGRADLPDADRAEGRPIRTTLRSLGRALADRTG